MVSGRLTLGHELANLKEACKVSLGETTNQLQRVSLETLMGKLTILEGSPGLSESESWFGHNQVTEKCPVKKQLTEGRQD